MSDNKFTQGKWIISDQKPNGIEIDAIAIQSDCEMKWDVCAVWNDLDEFKANALLISKAPEMLEVLQKIVLMTEICKGDFNDFKERYNIEIKQLIKEATEL